MASKPYNRNASTLEEAPPKPTYAETVLFQKGFRFQSRHGEPKVDLRAVSKVDIDSVIRNADLGVLQNLLENITFGELTESDLDLYSNDVFLKLFQLSQLTLEHLMDVQDTLCANLNGLAKKYAANKREMEGYATALARQDVQVATLRDSLHHWKMSVVSPTGVVDGGVFPIQEMRADEGVVAGLNDADAAEGKADLTEDEEGAIQLNIVSSIHDKYVPLKVNPMIAVQDLMKQLTEVLSFDTSDSEFWCLIFKSKRLLDSSQTLKDVGINADNNALVLELYLPDCNPTKEPDDSANKSQLPAASADAALASQMEELISSTKECHEELIEASRTMQHQASLQDEHNESVIGFLENHLKGLEDAVRDEIQLSLQKMLAQFGGAQTPCENYDASPELDLDAKLDIGEIESDDGEDDVKVTTAEEVNPKDEVEKRKVDLYIDTKAEYDGPICEESPYSIESPAELKEPTDDGRHDDCLFELPKAYNLNPDDNKALSEERPPTPKIEAPAKNDETDSKLTPALVSAPTPPSFKKIHGMEQEHFRFSEYESEDCVSINVLNQSYDTDNDFSKICGFTAPEITSAKSHEGGKEEDLDLQSIEVSQSEFQGVSESTKAEASKIQGKSGCMGRQRTGLKKLSFKKMSFPKMKKSKGKKGLSGEKGKLYGL